MPTGLKIFLSGKIENMFDFSKEMGIIGYILDCEKRNDQYVSP